MSRWPATRRYCAEEHCRTQVRYRGDLCRDCQYRRHHGSGAPFGWREKAACFDTRIGGIFPSARTVSPPVEVQRARFIRKYCRRCEVGRECRAEAAALYRSMGIVYGVWDGVDWSFVDGESVSEWRARVGLKGE